MRTLIAVFALLLIAGPASAGSPLSPLWPAEPRWCDDIAEPLSLTVSVATKPRYGFMMNCQTLDEITAPTRPDNAQFGYYLSTGSTAAIPELLLQYLLKPYDVQLRY